MKQGRRHISNTEKGKMFVGRSAWALWSGALFGIGTLAASAALYFTRCDSAPELSMPEIPEVSVVYPSEVATEETGEYRSGFNDGQIAAGDRLYKRLTSITRDCRLESLRIEPDVRERLTQQCVTLSYSIHGLNLRHEWFQESYTHPWSNNGADYDNGVAAGEKAASDTVRAEIKGVLDDCLEKSTCDEPRDCCRAIEITHKMLNEYAPGE